MNRKIAEMVVTAGVAVAALAGTASAQNSPASAALDASLRGAVERKDVPGVVVLITDRERVLYQGAFGRLPDTIDPNGNSHRLDDQAGHFDGVDATRRAGPDRPR